LSFERGKPLAALYVRKEAKDHGSKRLVENDKSLREGIPVVVLEDVITTGGSTLKSVEKLKAVGATVLGVIAIVDLVVDATLLPGRVGDHRVVDDRVDIGGAVLDVVGGVVEGQLEHLGLERVERLGGDDLADLGAVRGVAGVEADDDAGRQGRLADVADGGDQSVLVLAVAARGDGDDRVGGGEFAALAACSGGSC
jgi:hypothetical protein